MTTAALGLAIAALVLSAAALVLAVLVARQSAAVATTLARHRHGHNLREGAADPGAARPHGAQERPDVPTQGPPTSTFPAVTGPPPGPELRLPRPGEIGRRP